MGIFSGLFRSRDKPKDSYDSPSYSYFFGRTHAGKRVNDRTAMQIIAVYACVRVLSEAIAQLPLHVYQYTDNGKERVPMHPLYFLLHDQPNPEMTSFVFRETLMAHLLIYGNAYAQIIRNGRGEVLGLYPLIPDKVRVDRDDHGRLIYRYSRYDEHNPNFRQQGEIILPMEQVLHIPGLGFDGLVGYSPIAMAKNAIGLAVACDEYGASFFANGACLIKNPDFHIKCPVIDCKGRIVYLSWILLCIDLQHCTISQINRIIQIDCNNSFHIAKYRMCNPFNLQFFSYERIALIKLIEKEMIILIAGKIEPVFVSNDDCLVKFIPSCSPFQDHVSDSFLSA
ncbi:phage portal protein, HK97 family [Ruminococcus flavefaciens]|uniref:Phage portal protein, HK97 family n=1 Tax=Ruminococcus flavefaciens TaxID=1265 RepID=A0A1K1LJD5_RUMFL|nr:phage portal protein [Ruminococcus flavefaciens]SFW10989.1 phage portal protein, HK97 family [Ruminococcus flavefaciens]